MSAPLLNGTELITPTELSKFLKVSRSAISQWCKAGEINFIRLGKSIRFEPGEIKEWLQAKKNGGKQ